MAATRTFLQMRTRARQLAFQENSELVSEDELKGIVNEQCQALYDVLVGVRGMDYYSGSTTITSVADQAVYSLPDDFYQLQTAMVGDGSRTHNMATFEEQELATLLTMEQTGSHSYYDTRYRLKQAGIEFRPKPKDASWTFTLRYVPAMPLLVADGDVFDGVNGWEKWIELAAAIEMLNKDESDSTALQVQQQKIEQRIRGLAGSRDAGRPPRIVDTRGDWHDFYSDWDSN